MTKMTDETKKEVQDKAQLLLTKGAEQGFVTPDDILDIFPQAEENIQQIEDILVLLHEEGLEVRDEEDLASPQPSVAVQPPPPKVEAASGDQMLDAGITDSVSLYLRDIGRISLLTANEEVALAKQVERGNLSQRRLNRDGRDGDKRNRLQCQVIEGEQARQRLIEANSRLVVSIAKRYMGQGMPLSDLIQEGNLGLMKAIEKFDYRRGYKLSTYATWWIRQAVNRAIAEHGRTIRIPLHMSDQLRKLYRVTQNLEQNLGRTPGLEEIASEMDTSPQRVDWMLRVSRQPLSLAEPVGEEKDSELEDFIEDQEMEAPADVALDKVLSEIIGESLSELSDRELRIIQLRFGFVDGDPHTLQEIADEFGLSRERIRQIVGEAMHRLRHPHVSRKLKSYLS